MRVVTYNIRLALDSSLARIAEVLRDLSPDVVCLQEVGRHWEHGGPFDQRAVIAHEAGLEHAVYAPAMQRGAGQYGIALLSRHPITMLGRHPLPRLRDEPRVLLVARIATPDTPILLATTHLSVVPADRPEQWQVLTRQVLLHRGRGPLPTVIAGDLNANLDEPGFAEARGWLKMRSSHVEALGASPPTYPTKAPELAIDHVLISQDLAATAAGVSDAVGSDHLAAWADITPAPKARRR